MPDAERKRPLLVGILVLLEILLGLGAAVSGAILMAVPDGSLMQMPLSMLQFSPFKDFFVPGMILCSLLGFYPLLVAFCLWMRPSWPWPDLINPFKGFHWSWAASLASGVILMIWITVQVIMLRSAVFLHVLYFVWGAVLVLLTLSPSVRRYSTA